MTTCIQIWNHGPSNYGSWASIRSSSSQPADNLEHNGKYIFSDKSGTGIQAGRGCEVIFKVVCGRIWRARACALCLVFPHFSCHHNDLVNSPSNNVFCKDSLLDLLATGGLLGGVVGFLLSHKAVQFNSVQFIRSVGAYETKCGGKSVGSVGGKRYKSYVRNALKKFSFCGGAEGGMSCSLWNARIWSTHLLLVVIDELLIVLSSVSHGCCFCVERKGKAKGIRLEKR